jgi:hypothetical protein
MMISLEIIIVQQADGVVPFHARNLPHEDLKRKEFNAVQR